MGLRDDVTDRAQKRVGRVIKGKYALDRVIGIGGMATVYSATHRNKKRFAIKMLHPEVALDRDVTARFVREGYVANTVGHPGTVEVFDDDATDDGAPFLVMELLQGETLEARWERKGEQLPPTEVLPVADQLLDVLVAAHEKGIVHRDLKPENLFLTNDGRLKVLDFGIARLRELSHDSSAATRVGSLLGTPAFMAPEQSRGRWDEVDGRTDLWAVGAVLFTMLSGRYVHDAETVNEQIIMAATVPAPSIAKYLPELPPSIVELVDRALAFTKSNRWADAAAMQRATRGAIADIAGTEALSLPKPSVAVNVEQETLLAPSDSNPSADIEPKPAKSETLTTARAITSSASVAGADGKRSRRRAWIGFAAAVVCLGIAIGITWSRTDTVPHAHAGGSADPPAPTTTATAEPTGEAPETEKATVEPVTSPSTEADAGAEERAKPATKPKTAPNRPVARPEAKTAPSAAPAAMPKPEVKTVGPSPFDRRH